MQNVSLTDPPSLIADTTGELGELFRVGTAGTIPNGHGKGTVLIGTGGPLARQAATLSYALAWRGKVVNARDGRLKKPRDAAGDPGDRSGGLQTGQLV